MNNNEITVLKIKIEIFLILNLNSSILQLYYYIKMTMNEKDKIRIIIVDDHPLVRHGINKIISMEDDMAVCGEAESADDAIKLINAQEPNVAIVDITLAGSSNGIDLVKVITDRFPSIVCLVLSMHDESLYAERAIRAGSRGYITKNEASDNIVEAIREILEGNLFLSSDISLSIVDKLIKGKDHDLKTPESSLSNREFEVYQFIGQGLSTGEISKKLNISVNTIESHRRNIKKKLNLKNSSELVKSAVQWVVSIK